MIGTGNTKTCNQNDPLAQPKSNATTVLICRNLKKTDMKIYRR